jgi:hypothetical protein
MLFFMLFLGIPCDPLVLAKYNIMYIMYFQIKEAELFENLLGMTLKTYLSSDNGTNP